MRQKPRVGIVNYGSGNVASLKTSLAKIGYRPHMLEAPDDFNDAKVIIIPGVGAFPQAMDRLRSTGLDKAILAAHENGKRIVGICVGMQILADVGHEISKTEGLGLLGGEIRLHPDGLQVGWMALAAEKSNDPLIVDQRVYFNHSYYLKQTSGSVLYSCQSISVFNPAIVRKNNVIGIQFHPEKSQQTGLEILGRVIRGEIN